jgi:hypothetical protein
MGANEEGEKIICKLVTRAAVSSSVETTAQNPACYRLAICRNLTALLVAIALLLLPGLSHGKTIKDPIADYVAPDGFQEDMQIVKWDHIDRVELDLNRDGKKVVFLATSYVRHVGMFWTVYVPGKHGYTKGLTNPREGGMLCFSPEHCYVGYIREIKHRGIVFFVGRVVDGFDIIAFWVEDGKAHIKRIGETKPPKDEIEPDDPLFRKYFPDLTATIEHPPFASERLSMDDLRAKGYAIPKSDP